MTVLTNTKGFWIGIGAVAVGFSVFGVLVSRFLIDKQHDATVKPAAAVHKCEPGPQPCRASDGQHEIAIYFPQKIHYLTPFKLSVNLTGYDSAQVNTVVVEFAMLGMEMAANRYQLNRQTPNDWVSDVVLPVCVSGRRDWVVTVNVMTNDQTFVERFAFEVTG